MMNINDTLTYSAYGETFTVRCEVLTYGDSDRVALQFFDEEGPHGVLTTNLPDQHLNPGEVFVKDWSENAPLAQAAVDAGWLVPTGREVQSGFVFPKVMRLAGPLAS